MQHVNHFCHQSQGDNGENLASWTPALQAVLLQCTETMAPVRDKRVRHCPSLLEVLRKVRAIDADLYTQTNELLAEQNNWQPIIRASDEPHVSVALNAQRNLFRNVQIPEWLNSNIPAQRRSLQPCERRSLWSEKTFGTCTNCPGWIQYRSPSAFFPIFNWNQLLSPR